MRVTAIFPLLLAGENSINIPVFTTEKVGVSSQENEKVIYLEKKTLPSGTELHSIQELHDELPDIPIEEDNDEVMVPVYENGTVVSGYEHLIEPKVIVINREQLQKLNNSKPVNVGHPPGGLVDGIVFTEKGPIDPYPPNEIPVIPPIPEIPPIPVRREPSNEIGDTETAGADYDQGDLPDLVLPTAQDYIDSKEKDPDVETADDLTEKELQKIEQEIEEKQEQEKEEEGVELNKEVQEEEGGSKEGDQTFETLIKTGIEEEKENSKEATEIQEDINAIIKEAEEELTEQEIKEGVKELFQAVGDSIFGQETGGKIVSDSNQDPLEEGSSRKHNTNEQDSVDAPETPILKAGSGPVISGEKGYVLDTKSEEEEEQQEEPTRRPSRIHKGEVIGTRRKPDSARGQSVAIIMILLTLLFI